MLYKQHVRRRSVPTEGIVEHSWYLRLVEGGRLHTIVLLLESSNPGCGVDLASRGYLEGRVVQGDRTELGKKSYE
jgi:hypothetical protein